VLEQKLPGLRIGNQAGHDLTRYRNLKEDWSIFYCNTLSIHWMNICPHRIHSYSTICFYVHFTIFYVPVWVLFILYTTVFHYWCKYIASSLCYVYCEDCYYVM
jgi:hypothetical protein